MKNRPFEKGVKIEHQPSGIFAPFAKGGSHARMYGGGFGV
jgi:hypothetical protein